MSRSTVLLCCGCVCLDFMASACLSQGTTPLRLIQSKPIRIENELPDNIKLGPVIPGLLQGGIPQGLAYLPEDDWAVVSFHFDTKAPSMLAVLDMGTGNVAKSLTLLEQDGTPHLGHVGSVTVTKDHLCLSSGGLYRERPAFGVIQRVGPAWYADGAMYRISLAMLRNAGEVSTIRMQPWFLSETKGGGSVLVDDVLWIAEFVLDAKDKDSPHHVVDRDGKPQCAWVCGYRLDDEDNLIMARQQLIRRVAPDFVLVGPEEIQGITFLKGHVVLSRSHGINVSSTLEVFRDPRADGAEPHLMVTTSTGNQVPAWFLDKQQLFKSFKIVPMAQGIVAHKDGLALITESAAPKFKCKTPLDRIVLIEPK